MIPKYYEFQNKTKIISGLSALENLPMELNKIGVKRPMIIAHREHEFHRGLDILIKALKGSNVEIGCIYYVDTYKLYDKIAANRNNHNEIAFNKNTQIKISDNQNINNEYAHRENIDNENTNNQNINNEYAHSENTDIESNNIAKIALSEYKSNECDVIITLGGRMVFEVGNSINKNLLKNNNKSLLITDTIFPKSIRSPIFIAIPMGDSGIDIKGQPDLVILDPRMTMDLPFRETVLCAMNTLCNAIEAYTSTQKNPLSDCYAYSAISIVKDNLSRAVKCHRDKKARYALSQAALLSGIAFLNTGGGLVHSLAYNLEKHYKVSYKEVMPIILIKKMEVYMIRLEEYYNELLLPLAGPEIYADAPYHERPRKCINIIKNILDEYHLKYRIPVCLSEIGVKRSDFERLSVFEKQSGMEDNTQNEDNEKKEYILDILNMAF